MGGRLHAEDGLIGGGKERVKRSLPGKQLRKIYALRKVPRVQQLGIEESKRPEPTAPDAGKARQQVEQEGAACPKAKGADKAAIKRKARYRNRRLADAGKGDGQKEEMKPEYDYICSRERFVCASQYAAKDSGEREPRPVSRLGDDDLNAV